MSESTLEQLLEKSAIDDMTAIKLPKIAVIGDMTANMAKDFGFKVNYCPNNFLAEDFIAQFPGYPNNLNNTKILWPRTNYGRDFIAKELTKVGAQVHIVAAYKTELPKNIAQLSKQLQSLIGDKKIDAITLASKQTAINLAKIMQANKLPIKSAVHLAFISRNSLSPSFSKQEVQTSLKNTLQDILIVTIGPETSEGALNYLGKVDKEAKQHNADGIINALIEHFNEG
jgi:uroporphyrinogen-III synthase